MSTTTITPPGCTGANCPPEDRLDHLIHGRLSDPESAALTDHLDVCSGCQERVEALAVGGDPALSDAVKHLDRADPPSNSAYWRAVGKVHASLTDAYSPTDGTSATPVPQEGLKLDFLTPTETPGRLGRLSQFDVVRVVGRGGMGVVLHGFDECLQRDVAVKILDPQLASNDIARQRFCREARAAAAVSHDNLVAVHQVDEDEKSGLPFLVMQLVIGESLEQRLRRVGKLSATEVIKIGAQTAAGLTAAHANGLIHRDIKPGNILLETGTDKVKLTDFGLARAAEDLKLTKTGFVAGTPLYMAPEQARGDDVDARADLFSLGSVMYEALAGKPPFDGKTPLAVLRRVSDEAHEPLSKLNPEVPGWLEDVIDRLLEKEPADRFQTASEVADILAAHVALPATEVSDPGCLLSSRSGLSRRRKKVCGKQVAALAGIWVFGAVVGGYGTWALAPRTESVAQLPSTDTKPAAPAGPKPMLELPAGIGSGSVMSVAVSPDGATIATGAESGKVSLWAVGQSTPRLLYTLIGHTGPVWSIEFTPDGKRLVSAGDDASVKVWDLDTRESETISVGLPVRSACLSPNGHQIAVGNRQGDVTIFDLTMHAPIGHFRQSGSVNAVAFSPDGMTIAAGYSDSRVVLWELAGGKERTTLNGHPGPVYGLTFSGDGQRLASAGWDPTVIVWDVNTNTKVRSIDVHEEGVLAVQFTPCGRFLATGGQDGTAKLWDADTGANLATFSGHRGPVLGVDFGKIGSVLASGGRDGTVKVWDSVPYLHCDTPSK